MSTQEGYCNVNRCTTPAVVWWYPFGGLCAKHRKEVEENEERLAKKLITPMKKVYDASRRD
jgi:hypothetical protein